MYFLSQNERLLNKPSIYNKKIELNNGNKSENTDTNSIFTCRLRPLADEYKDGGNLAGTQNILISSQLVKLLNLSTKICGMKIYITMDNIIEFCKAV